jgi:putative transposase
MANKLTPITEQYQHFVQELKESFWGDLYREGQQALKQLLEAESERERQRYLMRDAYERKPDTQDYRNGSYERDVVTRLGTIRFRVARTRQKAFLPKAVERLQRRAEDVALLIREAFLRGISTRQVGRVIGVITGEVVSAQTVSKISRSLDGMVQAFHQARLSDEWVYLFLDGGEFAGEAAGRAQAGADAGGLWSRGGWPTAVVRVSAQSGREPARLGRAAG